MVHSQTQCDHHLAFLSCDLTGVPNHYAPCKRCQHPKENWFCLSCKDIFCSSSVYGHFIQHYQETKHCLCVNCRCGSDPKIVGQGELFPSFSLGIGCCQREWRRHTQKGRDSCPLSIHSHILHFYGRSSSSKLECIDAMIVDVIDLLSKPFPSISVHPQLDAQSFVGQDELALAEEGLQKSFSFTQPHCYQPSSCPSELKVNLSSFRCNLPEETSAFIKAQDELKVASDLSASVTQKKFVVRQQTSKYDEVKNEIVASDEKVANFKAMIKELEAQIKRLEACLATEESNRAKIDEAIDSIEKQVTTARDGLVSDLAQVSSMEGSTQATNELVARKQSDWDNLKSKA